MMAKRSDANEKRARSLFDALGVEQRLIKPSARMAWDDQPDIVKEVFRNAASFNTFHHPSGQSYCWSFDGDAIMFEEETPKNS